MGVITFQTVLTDDHVIRPPAQVILPTGAVEVTVRAVAAAGSYGGLRGLAGCLDSGVPDAGLRHDEYLGEALEEELRGNSDA
jgi:hypothetical protein